MCIVSYVCDFDLPPQNFLINQVILRRFSVFTVPYEAVKYRVIQKGLYNLISLWKFIHEDNFHFNIQCDSMWLPLVLQRKKASMFCTCQSSHFEINTTSACADGDWDIVAYNLYCFFFLIKLRKSRHRSQLILFIIINNS